MLSIGGALIGIGIAAVCAPSSGRRIASELPLKLDARVDLRVALFALAVGLVSGVASGFGRQSAARAPISTRSLKATESCGSPSRGWMRQALVVAQVAVALVMMVLSASSSRASAPRADPATASTTS